MPLVAAAAARVHFLPSSFCPFYLTPSPCQASIVGILNFNAATEFLKSASTLAFRCGALNFGFCIFTDMSLHPYHFISVTVTVGKFAHPRNIRPKWRVCAPLSRPLAPLSPTFQSSVMAESR